MKVFRQISNPVRFTAHLFIIMFSLEVLVHSLILPWIGFSTSIASAFIDALVLVVLISPAARFLIYKPLASEISKRRGIEEEYQVIFENSPNAILAVVDQTGKIVRVNPQTEKTFGYDPRELMGKEVEILIPDRFRGTHRGDRSEYMKAPTARPMGAGRDLRGLRKDGSEFPVEIALTPVKMTGQTMILVTITDITVRKSLEMQRDQAIEAGRIGLWEWEPTTGLLDWSDRCRKLFRISSETQLSYEVFLNAISPLDRDRIDRAVKDALEQKKPYEGEMRIQHPDGAMHWILAKGRGYYDHEGKIERMRGVVLDITEQKRSTFLRDEVIGIVSHDLKNPLTSISLTASALGKMRPSDEFALNQIEKIQNTIKQMDRLLSDLLDVTKLESGHVEVALKEQSVQFIVDEVIATLHPLLNEKRIKVEIDQNNLRHKVFCDHDRMVQVFSNILGNSIKFTREGGSITLRFQDGIEWLTVSISDTGQGIAPEELLHVFDRFWQAKRTKKAGAGLGLAIVKGIIESHGGKVWIESQLDQGTTVHFTLPTAMRTVA